MAITDLTGTTWLINDTFTTAPGGWSLSGEDARNETFSINFTNNGQNSTTLNFYDADYAFDGMIKDVVGGSNVTLYNSNGWLNGTSKVFTFTGGTDVTNADLIAWLEANAEQQVEPEPTGVKNILFGTQAIDKILFGQGEVSKIYLGQTLVWQANSSTPENALIVADGGHLKASDGYLTTTESTPTITFVDDTQWNDYAQDLDHREYSIDNGQTWETIPNTLPISISSNQIMLRLGYGFSGNIKPKAVCSALGLDTGYIASSSSQTQNYSLIEDITIQLSVLYDD